MTWSAAQRVSVAMAASKAELAAEDLVANKAAVNKIALRPENRRCADCGAKPTRWYAGGIARAPRELPRPARPRVSVLACVRVRVRCAGAAARTALPARR